VNLANAAKDDIQGCYDLVKASSDCGNADGLFTYSKSFGWCRCCSNKDDALTNHTSNSNFNIYQGTSTPAGSINTITTSITELDAAKV